MPIRLLQGDCLQIMPTLAPASVDLILCDLPYGTTDCKWDTIIPLPVLWGIYARVTKANAAYVFTGTQPFVSELINSNHAMFRYDIIWDKVNRNTGYGNVKRMPLRRHEHILLFYRSLPTYNPQMIPGTPYIAKRSGAKPGVYASGGLNPKDGINEGIRFPVSILPIKADVKTEVGLHPTQKPVALMEYLIKTYTNPGDTVLDNCMGSGTTGVACVNTGREFIGIEQDPNYFQIASTRIAIAEYEKACR